MHVVPGEQRAARPVFAFASSARGILATMAQTPQGQTTRTAAAAAARPRRGAGRRTHAWRRRARFARAGFADPTLVLRWDEIAGAETARLARPLKLSEGPSGGVLTLKAEPGAAALPAAREPRAVRADQRLSRPAGGRAAAIRARARSRRVRSCLPAPAPRPPVPATDPARNMRGRKGFARPC